MDEDELLQSAIRFVSFLYSLPSASVGQKKEEEEEDWRVGARGIYRSTGNFLFHLRCLRCRVQADGKQTSSLCVFFLCSILNRHKKTESWSWTTSLSIAVNSPTKENIADGRETRGTPSQRSSQLQRVLFRNSRVLGSAAAIKKSGRLSS